MKKILITGGFGYVGGRLASFLSPNYDIILGSRSDRVLSGSLKSAEVFKMNWESRSELERTCSSMDAIVHSAGMNAQDCAKDPVSAIEFNAVGTAKLIEAAIKNKVQKFIYISTAHVYSNNLIGEITEKNNTTNLHPYATSHKAAEDIVRYYSEKGDIEGIVLRLSNSFGAPVQFDVNCWMLLVNDLCLQAIKNKKLVLRSNGLQRRDFIPLADVCSVINHFITLPKEKSLDGLFNVGGEYSPTVWEFTNRIAKSCSEVLGFEPAIERKDPVPGDTVFELNYSIEKLKQTGFVLTGNVDKEIQDTLKFCQKNI